MEHVKTQVATLYQRNLKRQLYFYGLANPPHLSATKTLFKPEEFIENAGFRVDGFSKNDDVTVIT